jgi:tRNA (mo5U34)-methyltransferase
MSMPDDAALAGVLEELQLEHWLEPLHALSKERLSTSAHGDLAHWQAAVRGLGSASSDAERRALLLQLAPWRKGPFVVGGVHIDAELLGIDPTLLYVMQFLAVTAHMEDLPVAVLPLRLQELPDASRAFDTTFSMGVLYHQRSPIDHLRQLRGTLRHGGQLVLETIFIPGEEPRACTPAERYARMKNVWLLPTLAELTTWLRRTKYRDIEIIDTAITTSEEQRSTEWMSFESLAEALDPRDPTRTVEGWPAPRRVVVTATADGH